MEPRRSGVEDPAIDAVEPPQAVGHHEALTGVERPAVNLEDALAVLGMNTLGPAVAELLLDPTACKGDPAIIDESTEFVGAAHPDHHRRGVGHQAKPLLALAHRFVGA